MLVRRLEMLPVEFVVRGYLAGTGFIDYQATGAVSGVALPAGLRLADRLPEPVVTPAFKATSGHDSNITADEARALCGGDPYDRAAAAALAVYLHAVRACARPRHRPRRHEVRVRRRCAGRGRARATRC